MEGEKGKITLRNITILYLIVIEQNNGQDKTGQDENTGSSRTVDS